ncbi:unnamed protein product [Medioppia subpectinata]|uniref:DOMON domain-containing protein n=1 Tax=Medioppia subpectinata TaxID=1979941 RepID=A0A7R9KLZ4_9ACAR|nr:unnamed protein product [Medioppia subpectinata]CAG2106038.1 unnamed protein product [Medioppia subpectinata]
MVTTTWDSQAIHISAPVVIQHKPSLAYNRQGEPAESKQTSPGAAPPKGGDNLHASSVPHGQSSVAELGGHSRIPYDVCDRRFCIGLPANCVQYRTCNMLLSGGYVSRGDGMVEFEVYADVNKYNGNSYYSVGLSTDNKMGDDSVTDCMVSDGRPLIRNSVNIGRSNEYLSQNEYHSVTPLNTTYANGVLYCKWRRRRRSTIRGQQYDIKDRKYYVLLAFGLLGQNKDKEFHTERLASDRAVDIRQIGHVHTQSSAFLIRIHGTFMIVAWLGCGPHQLFGLAAVIISVLNPIGAAIRPKADSSKRWIFNWFHFLVGNAGHVCAITALFLAYNITVNQLSPIYLWILIMYIF